jgi:hypothetical protein
MVEKSKKRYRYPTAVRHLAAHYIMTRSGRVSMAVADVRAVMSYAGKEGRLPDELFRHVGEIDKYIITALGILTEKI